ncbi:glucosaminidase domain-containing protein [Paenibacillus chitinolyticus]|uniref:glucosaminidase domain-containing protein n=1 Tax=Paenibacillus chitinolyticus TaxID=79263 RepID=UPI0036DC5FD6
MSSSGTGQSLRGSSANAQKLNTQLGGVLKNYGGTIEKLAQKYNIDPALGAAIIMHETGNGTSNAAKSKNNVGGMMGKNGLITYPSIEAGIDAMFSNLKRNYFDSGLTSIEAIQKKYAPIGAKNDPTGLNKNWVPAVTKYYNALRR